ncbi:hypothetical protein H8E77_32815 [bacterium]|nr:hypothetical protein [bacterium]
MTRAAHSPELAFAPKPPDGAADQPTKLTLSWTASHPDNLPMTFDVHLGTAAAVAVDRLPRVKENLTESECKVSELKNNETYFWQVITKDDQGNSTPGLLWSFSTMTSNQPPDLPFNPSPSNDAKGIGRGATLSWSAYDPDGDPMTYDVYLGTWGPIPITVEDIKEFGYLEGPLASDLEVPQYTPPTMKPNETYFWRVVVKDNTGNSTVGEHWSFSTELNSPPDPPFNPSPSDKGTNVDTDCILSWSAYDPDGDPMTYEVFVNVTSELSQFQTLYPFSHNVWPYRNYLEVPQFIPSCSYDIRDARFQHDKPLQRKTTYFWKVVVKDNVGNSTEGDVWSFTTGPRPAYLSYIDGVGLTIPISINDHICVNGKRGHKCDEEMQEFQKDYFHTGDRVDNHEWVDYKEQKGLTKSSGNCKWEGNSFTCRSDFTKSCVDCPHRGSELNSDSKRTIKITGTFSADFDMLESLTYMYTYTFNRTIADTIGHLKVTEENIYFSFVLSNVPLQWVWATEWGSVASVLLLTAVSKGEDISSCEAEGEANEITTYWTDGEIDRSYPRTSTIESVEITDGEFRLSFGLKPCLPEE